MSPPVSRDGAAGESSAARGEMEVKTIGLTELYVGKSPEADIIFVHGSGGSPKKTWVYKGNLRRDLVEKAYVRSIVDRLMARVKRGTRDPVFWPADILPHDHQDVRILTYGYQSGERRIFSRSTNKLTMSQHGNQFLESIARTRNGARGRPIIFVAHDRGGLIVKQAIVESKKQKKQRCPELHDVYESFHGVIFLGTPHRGPHDAIRTLTPAGMSPEVDLKAKAIDAAKIESSRKKSKLNDLYNDFCDIIIEEEVIRVSNFQEAKKKARILATKKMVSDYFSTFGVRDWERTDVINADRMNMCRFPNREDDGYDKVRNAIGFHLATKRSKSNNDGSCAELSSVDPSNGENTANWRESNTSTIIFDCNGLSQDCKERISQWLQRLAPSKSQVRLRNEYLQRREDGTGSWFLGTNELDQWLNEPQRNRNPAVHRMLWFNGEPGVGKSILSCLLIEHLEQISTAANFGFGWFICHIDEEQSGTQLSLSITQKLLQQLLKQETTIPANVFRIYKKYEKYDGEELEPLEDECLELLKSVVAKFSKVYIVIDGLDELRREVRTHAIKTLEALLSSHAYIVITTRTGEPDIEQSFCRRASRLNIKASEPDIWTYLENNISKPSPLATVLSSHNQGLKEETISTISQNSDGLMLLAQQNLKELADENTLEGLETALANLSSNVDALYEDTWNRIRNKNSPRVFERVQQVLMWVAYASRPLTVPELRHALAVRDDSEEFNSKALWDTPLDESALGLLVIDDDQTVRFCHKSAHSFFESDSEKFPNANEIIAKTCLRYLLLNSISPGDNPTIEDIARQVDTYPFHNYAFENWLDHAKHMTPEVQELALRFVRDNSKVTTSYRLYHYSSYGEDSSKVEFTGMTLMVSLESVDGFISPHQELEEEFHEVNFIDDTSLQSIVELDEGNGEETFGDNRVVGKEDVIDEGKEEDEGNKVSIKGVVVEEEVAVEVAVEEKEIVKEEEEVVGEEEQDAVQSPHVSEPDANSLEKDTFIKVQVSEKQVGERVVDEFDDEDWDLGETKEVLVKTEEAEAEGEQQSTAVEDEMVEVEAGDDTVIINRDPATPASVDIQKAIRDFLVGEGKISSREGDGTQTPGDDFSSGWRTPRDLRSEDGSNFGESNANSPKKHTPMMHSPSPKSGLDTALKAPTHHDDSQTEPQTPDNRTTFSLIAERSLSSSHMRTVTPNFKLPSTLMGRPYPTPSSSLKDRSSALPLYLTPMGEREGLMTKQYASNSLPRGKGARSRSTSEGHELDGVLTLPKRNLYLYPTMRDKYDSMFNHGGKSG
ncbi:hypothetical protein FQN54_006680 [Arachnomyces sp. PD_36]|nr:hypothetical protein FQN54_006680 [Arachnomyces sp. PD_36]